MQAPDYQREFQLDDDGVATIRPIRPEDAEIEDRFVRGLSERSRYLRFMYALEELTPRLLDHFINPDFPREMALIATLPDVDSGGEREIAVARYASGDAPDTAEFAIVVEDEWQGHGLATTMLESLFEFTREAGYRRVEGLVLAENRGMLDFSRRFGFTIKRDPEDMRLVRVHYDLGPETA